MFQTVLVAAEWINIQAFTDFFRDVKRKFKARREANQTVNELSALSDRELNDIGINRGEIRAIAESVYNENLRGWV